MGVMVLGVGVYGFVIGNVAHILMNIDPVRSEQLQRMEQLAAFMRYRKLPRRLQDRVADYFRYLWRHQMDHDESEILRRLPPALQTELTLYLKRDLLEAVPLFRDTSEAFLREVALGMQPVIFLPGDSILRAGDRGRAMYFITRGEVDILTADETKRLARLGKGDFLGEMALVFDEPRMAHARAVDYCDLYRLDRALFERLLSMHPEVAEQIRAAAYARRDGGAGKDLSR
jgi:voltage-gated potassium channel